MTGRAAITRILFRMSGISWKDTRIPNFQGRLLKNSEIHRNLIDRNMVGV